MIYFHSGRSRRPHCGAVPKVGFEPPQSDFDCSPIPGLNILATRHSDGAIQKSNLSQYLRRLRPCCCCCSIFRFFSLPEFFAWIRREPRQNVFNRLSFLRGEVSGGGQLCDGQRQAGKALEFFQRFFLKSFSDCGCAFVQIAEMGAYVKLLEYDNIDGMILLSELSRRRIRSIQKLIRIGRNEVVIVLRVDKEKGKQPLGSKLWRGKKQDADS